MHVYKLIDKQYRTQKIFIYFNAVQFMEFIPCSLKAYSSEYL